MGIISSLDKWLKAYLYVYCFCTRAYSTIGLRLAQHITPLTSAITAMGWVCFQYLIFQFWCKFTIWWETSSHRNYYCKIANIISQLFLIGGTHMSELTEKQVREIVREEIIKHMQRQIEIVFPPCNLDELEKLNKSIETKKIVGSVSF